MCISVKEMNDAMEEIRSLKMLREETEDAIKALEMKVIEFLEETEGCQTVNKAEAQSLNLSGTAVKPPIRSRQGKRWTRRK